MLDGVPDELEFDYLKCSVCIQNKIHNLLFDNSRSRATEVLEIVHTDLNGPHSTVGLNGERFLNLY